MGAPDLPVWGEVIFNTSMTGYQEVLTDPSYAGQIVVMTYPQIGNYGVRASESEQRNCAARALVVRELSPFFSPGPGRYSLEQFMNEHGLPGLSGVDTRSVTMKIRSGGAVVGAIGPSDHPDGELAELARERSASASRDLVESVTGRLSGDFLTGFENLEGRRPGGALTGISREGAINPKKGSGRAPDKPFGASRRVKRAAVLDLGIKKSIIESLLCLGVEIQVFDMHFSVPAVLGGGFDFAVFSNGPGDPTEVPGVIAKVERLLGKIPILGICLGHQITALALGARTFKLKFGHRGSNQPVICRREGRVFITSQNHGYAVSEESLASVGAVITYTNANDGTVEGFELGEIGVECVQFHPEASPGPLDTSFIFREFSEKVSEKNYVVAWE